MDSALTGLAARRFLALKPLCLIQILLIGALSWRVSVRAETLSDLIAGPPQLLAAEFNFTEGPVWTPPGGLLFSDNRDKKIHEWTPDGGTSGTVRLFKALESNSNGLTLDRQNRLLLCETQRFRVSRMAADGTLEPVASLFQGSPFHSPNDLAVHSSGRMYFTDPDYSCATCPKNQPVQGVYCWDPLGTVTLQVSNMIRPNGLAFSPDESRLYVGSVFSGYINVYDVSSTGSLLNGRFFCAANHPDGMKVDRAGRLWVSVDEGLAVFDAAGALIGNLTIGSRSVNTTNVAFGDPFAKTLFITAADKLYRLPLRQPGIFAGNQSIPADRWTIR